jgi:hypothetical protein
MINEFEHLINAYYQAEGCVNNIAAPLTVGDTGLQPELFLWRQQMESGTPTLYQAIQDSDAIGRKGEVDKSLVGMKLQQVYGVDEYFLNQLTRSIRICGNTGTDMTAYRKVFMKSTATLKELISGVVSSFGPHVSLSEAVPDVVRAILNDNYWEGEDIIAAVNQVRLLRDKLHFDQEWLGTYSVCAIRVR